MTVYLNIGSNQGDRHALIEQAVALVCEAYPQARVRCSSYVESEPWGYESDHAFLNLGVAIDIEGEVDPMAVLDEMQAIEGRISRAAHRNADGSYRDRELDIDIIAIDAKRLSHQRLQLPHPRAHLREFVMQPMRQLAPAALIAELWG